MKSEKKNITHGDVEGEQSAPVNSEYIFTAMRLPLSATPFGGCPFCSWVFRPTAIPDTWVPCSQPAQAMLQLNPEPAAVEDDTPPGHSDAEPPDPSVPCVVEKQPSATVLPA